MRTVDPSTAPVTAPLESVPEPVARYFRFALRGGSPAVRAATLRQTGTMRADAHSAWHRFTAVERFTTQPVGFTWDASMQVGPFNLLRVRDSYAAGEGASELTFGGIVPLLRRRGTPAMRSGALLRYLAELAWLPTALLPNERIAWSALEADRARVTLHDSGTTVGLDMTFAEDGSITSVRAERYRVVGGRFVLTPWIGRFSEYTRVHGMMIPLAGEVAWGLPDGPAVMWRGRLAGADYEFGDRAAASDAARRTAGGRA
jgi:hypothetical protein